MNFIFYIFAFEKVYLLTNTNKAEKYGIFNCTLKVSGLLRSQNLLFNLLF